ncbi:MAG: dTDP-4-amino-4,6-dideoxygalactose transaminase, partial [Mariniphaga sp.]
HHISGNGKYTKLCQKFFENQYGFRKCLLTTSCTDALEMAAILCDIQSGDEVIVPSYTFVSTALAFVRQGAKIIFADSMPDHPNIDADKIESLITTRTKVIVPVHYAGVACDMDKIMELAEKYNLFVVEDAAQAIDSYYISPRTGEKKALGSIGNLAAFSFHETKNIISGEGGMLAMNDERFLNRAEIIWEKGTNRAEFFRGEVNKYGWVDIGSSFLPSEVIAAFLWAQIESIAVIQQRRKEIWKWYNSHVEGLFPDFRFTKPYMPDYATNNAHMYYLVLQDIGERTRFINHLKENGIHSVFHYLSLHKSPYYQLKYSGYELPHSDRFSDCLVRLPMFYELNTTEVYNIINNKFNQ